MPAEQALFTSGGLYLRKSAVIGEDLVANNVTSWPGSTIFREGRTCSTAQVFFGLDRSSVHVGGSHNRRIAAMMFAYRVSRST